MKNKKGYTLIELMVSIVIVLVVTAAIYFCMNSAIESWSYSRDELSLQKVLSDTMDKVIVGDPGKFGLKDSLEIMAAGESRVEFVPPWIDETHSIEPVNYIYTLNRKIKPGTALPIAQVKLPEQEEWRLVPVGRVELEENDAAHVRLDLALSSGGEIRFTYHPDPGTEPDVVRKIYWDSGAKQVILEGLGEKENLSANPFGVEITKMEFHYYTNANQRITDRQWVDLADIPVITAVEVILEASVNDRSQSLRSFISLRNAPMRTGYLSLRPGLKIHIPDSRNIHTLMITNITGVANNDVIDVMAVPKVGKIWRLKIEFEKSGDAKPTIKMVTVEYPPQTPVYTDTPHTTADLGLNLKILDPNGEYDYDDDGDVDDLVTLEGDVEFIVSEMSVKGAGLFVRP